MRYVERFNIYIDDDLVVYRMTPRRGNHGYTPGTLHQLRTYMDRCGYMRVSTDGNPYLHQVVAEAFLGPNTDGITVDHIDRNKLNNCPENLRYASRKQQADNTSKVIRSVEKYGVRQSEDSAGYHRRWRAENPGKNAEYTRRWKERKKAAMN